MVHRYFIKASNEGQMIDNFVEYIYGTIEDGDGENVKRRKRFSEVFPELFGDISGANIETFLSAVASSFAYEADYNDQKSKKIKDGLKSLFSEFDKDGYRKEENVHTFQFWTYLIDMYEFISGINNPEDEYPTLEFMTKISLQDTKVVIVGDDYFPYIRHSNLKGDDAHQNCCATNKFLHGLNVDLNHVDSFRNDSKVTYKNRKFEISKKKMSELEKKCDLKHLAEQNVLLMNSMLNPGIGWKDDGNKIRDNLSHLTTFFVSYLAGRYTGLSFIFIGDVAASIVESVDPKNKEENLFLTPYKTSCASNINKKNPEAVKELPFVDTNYFLFGRMETKVTVRTTSGYLKIPDKELICWWSDPNEKMITAEWRIREWNVLCRIKANINMGFSSYKNVEWEKENKAAYDRFKKGITTTDAGPGYIYIYEFDWNDKMNEDMVKCNEKPEYVYKIGMSKHLPKERVNIQKRTNNEKYRHVYTSSQVRLRRLADDVVKLQLKGYNFKREDKPKLDGQMEWYREKDGNGLEFFKGKIDYIIGEVNTERK